jgi:hypothetical protein
VKNTYGEKSWQITRRKRGAINEAMLRNIFVIKSDILELKFNEKKFINNKLAKKPCNAIKSAL